MEVISNKNSVKVERKQLWINDFTKGDVIISSDDTTIVMLTDEDYVCVLCSDGTHDPGDLIPTTDGGEIDGIMGPFQLIRDAALYTKYFENK